MGFSIYTKRNDSEYSIHLDGPNAAAGTIRDMLDSDEITEDIVIVKETFAEWNDK